MNRPLRLAASSCLAVACAASRALGAGEPVAAAMQENPRGIETVTLPSATTPLVAIRLQLKVGSANDPAGKAGLASLTALMVAEAGTRKRSYSELLDALYPLAAQIDDRVDRETTVFAGTVHRDTLAAYTKLLTEALIEPAFTESDFARNRDQLLSQVTNDLRGGSDERLGLEALQDLIFAGHPYGHPAAGTVAGLNSITLEDVRRFYGQHYTRANLLLGVAGGYPAGYVGELAGELSALPEGRPERLELPAPPTVTGRHIVLIEKQTGSVGIHFGYPLPINRSDPDFYPLLVANSALGEHRTATGRLMSELREVRGLNYGDYSYIEHWTNPPATRTPLPGAPRRQQYFSVWLRPVAPGDARFALRAALYEVQRLHNQGLSAEEFELTRSFLIHYSKLWVESLPTRLGFAMDSRAYGMPYYVDEIERRLSRLTLDEVNRVIRKYISTDAFDAVLVTAGAQQLKQALEADGPSPKSYASQVAPEVHEADRRIEKLKVAATAIDIVPVAQMFEK